MIEAPVTPQVSTEKTSPLKLSDLLRLGSLDTKQDYVWLYNRHFDGDRYCALGTIAYAAGWRPDEDAGHIAELNEDIWKTYLGESLDSDLSIRWPTRPLPCDGDCLEDADVLGQNVMNVIVHLNDRHQWTRARIADTMEAIGL